METYLGRVENLVRRDRLGNLVDLVGDVLRSGATVRHVVLDPEVCIGSSRIMASGQQDTASRLVLANDVGSSWGGEDGVLADDELGDAVGGGDAKDDLDGWNGEVTAVTTDDEGSTLGSWGRDRIEDSLDKVFGVVLLLKDLDAVIVE